MIHSERRPGVWRDAVQIFPELWSFLRRPSIGEADTKWTPLIWRQLFLLYLFDLLLVIPLMFYNISYEELLIAAELDVPEHNGFDNYDSLWTIWFVVGIVAPIVEELIFRGWLRGTPRQISMLVSIVAAVILLVVFAEPIRDLPLSTRAFLLSAILAGIVGLYLEIFFRTKAHAEPIFFFERYFPFIFWTAAAVFGLLHMTNYEGGSLLTTVPVVLPQLLAAPLLAFARLRFGLRASILLHSASNNSVVLLWAAADFLSGS